MANKEIKNEGKVKNFTKRRQIMYMKGILFLFSFFAFSFKPIDKGKWAKENEKLS